MRIDIKNRKKDQGGDLGLPQIRPRGSPGAEISSWRDILALKEKMWIFVQNVIYDVFKKKDLKIKISPKIVDKVIEESDYSKFGARRVDKVIDNIVIPVIVDAWYNGKKEITVWLF